MPERQCLKTFLLARAQLRFVSYGSMSLVRYLATVRFVGQGCLTPTARKSTISHMVVSFSCVVFSQPNRGDVFFLEERITRPSEEVSSMFGGQVFCFRLRPCQEFYETVPRSKHFHAVESRQP